MGSLMNLILVIILFGIALGIINALIPMARVIKSLLNIFVGIIVILYILQFFHLIPQVVPMLYLIR